MTRGLYVWSVVRGRPGISVGGQWESGNLAGDWQLEADG